MISSSDMNELRLRLEVLRERTRKRQVTEHEVWQMLEHINVMIDDAQGGPYESLLDSIHTLVSSVWSNVRSSERLHTILDHQ